MRSLNMFDEDPGLIEEEFYEESADKPYTDEMINDIERIFREMRK